MDSRAARTVALMSIHPRFVERILDGEKRVEFRKTAFRHAVTHVLIYSTEPVSKIVGIFEVSGVECDSPDDLWARFELVAGLPSEEFHAYYSGCEVGVAIQIGRVFRLDAPRTLEAVLPGAQAPQSFRYCEPGILDRLIAGASEIAFAT